MSIICFVQVTFHVTYDVITSGDLDYEASCLQATPEQAVDHRVRSQGHDEGDGHWCVVVDIVEVSSSMIDSYMRNFYNCKTHFKEEFEEFLKNKEFEDFSHFPINRESNGLCLFSHIDRHH